jgi:hypothetical protein
VAIARALIHHPQIICADEPTGNLDPVSTREITDLLLEINSYGTTVIATHRHHRARHRPLACGQPSSWATTPPPTTTTQFWAGDFFGVRIFPAAAAGRRRRSQVAASHRRPPRVTTPGRGPEGPERAETCWKCQGACRSSLAPAPACCLVPIRAKLAKMRHPGRRVGDTPVPPPQTAGGQNFFRPPRPQSCGRSSSQEKSGRGKSWPGKVGRPSPSGAARAGPSQPRTLPAPCRHGPRLGRRGAQGTAVHTHHFPRPHPLTPRLHPSKCAVPDGDHRPTAPTAAPPTTHDRPWTT